MAIVITPDTVRLDYLGTAVTVTVQPDEEGYAVDDESEYPDWIHLSGDLVIADDERGEVTVRADENTSRDARSGRVGFHLYAYEEGYSYLTVEQEGVPVEPHLTIDPAERTVEADDLSDHISAVDSSDGTCEVDGDTVPDWLYVRSIMEPQVGVSEVDYECLTANGTAVARTAVVRLYNGDGAEATLTVTQLGRGEPEGWRVAHWGQFPDIRGRVWECDILLKTDGEVEARELTFPADQPLVIEWPSINFEDAVWGSSATLKVVSPGDRTYIDLYTIEPGTIRLDVYRDGSLWWSGMLDPEFYEEPYEMLQGYEVELTFTDFGILDRLKFDMEGIVSVRDIIDGALERGGINYGFMDVVTFLSIRFPSSAENGIITEGGIAVRADNFTDEEGEVSTLKEVLEGVLQPLGAKIVQRGGGIYVFDVRGVYDSVAEGADAEIPAVVWSGDSQTLGVDRVYNSVKVTFSPYAQYDFLKDGVTFDAPYDVTDINTNAWWPGSESDDPKYWTFAMPERGEYKSYSFTIFLSEKGSGVASFTGYTLREYFHILPIYGSADDCSGIPILFYTGNAFSEPHGQFPGYYNSGSYRLFTLPRIYIPTITDETERSKYLLRFSMETLVSCLYDPFADEKDSLYDYSDNQENLEKYSASMHIPLYVTIYDSAAGGTALLHYSNHGHFVDDQWFEGEASYGEAWLSWYDKDDQENNAGAVGGWKGNRQKNVTYATTAMYRNADDGEYMNYPPSGGWIEFSIGNAMRGFRYNSEYSLDGETDDWLWEGLKTKIRWILYRNFEMIIVKNNFLFDDADLDDVEYSGMLNESAADELSIDTVCGTCEDTPPTARGVYYDLSDGSKVSELYRDGVTARPEELLIGSLYSQYAGRKTVLTGEACIPETAGLNLLHTEQNQGDRRFILTADCQDVRMGTSDIEIREIGTDTYTVEDNG